MPSDLDVDTAVESVREIHVTFYIFQGGKIGPPEQLLVANMPKYLGSYK